jgi:hypothetical protein
MDRESAPSLPNRLIANPLYGFKLGPKMLLSEFRLDRAAFFGYI